MLGAVSLWNFHQDHEQAFDIIWSWPSYLVLLCHRTDGRTRQASEEQLTNEQAALQAEVKREKQLAATWMTQKLLSRSISGKYSIHMHSRKNTWHYNTSLAAWFQEVAPWHHYWNLKGDFPFVNFGDLTRFNSRSSKAMEESADELAEGWYTVSRKGDSWKIWWRSWPLDDRSNVKKQRLGAASVVKCATFIYLILILFW